MASVLLEARPYRPFKSSEEYLYAMREDLAEWLNTLYPELMINVDNFMDRLDTGIALCKVRILIDFDWFYCFDAFHNTTHSRDLDCQKLPAKTSKINSQKFVKILITSHSNTVLNIFITISNKSSVPMFLCLRSCSS